MDVRKSIARSSRTLRGAETPPRAGRVKLWRRGNSSFPRLVSCVLAAAAAAAIVIAFAPRHVRPALKAGTESSPALAFAARLDPGAFASTGGRLIRVFGSLPPRALCRNAHWQWQDLSGLWFASADCTDAQLQSARLIGTNFRGATLAGAQMQDAIMWYANLDSAHLQKANLKHADLARASLRQASLEGANLQRAIFKAANLTQANFLGADLRYANFTAANLQGALLTGQAMDGVDFTRANLAGADLSRADLRNARGLTAAQLKLANTDSGTRMPEGMPPGIDPPSQ